MSNEQEISRTTSQRSAQQDGQSLHRMYSGQYLDDQSVYIGQLDPDETDSQHGSDISEDLREKDDEEAVEEGQDKIFEVRDGIPNERDLEAQPKLEKSRSSKSARDPNIITWDGPDDPASPKNWSFKQKWAATFVVSSFTFISPVSSSMVAPALTSLAQDLNITSEVEVQLTLSIFVLGFAIGPLILGPFSEIYGRIPILQLANLFFLVFNIACGVCTSKGQLLAFRFLAGLGGSAPLAIGGGVLSDCWRPEQRGKAVSLYSLAPLLGPAVGPIAGGFIAEKTTWRWVFYSTSIVDGIIQAFGLLFLRETYAPKLLQNKVLKLRKETGNMNFRTEFDHPDRKLSTTLKHALVRPFRLLATQPIVQFLAVYMAYTYGIMYLVLSTFPTLWTVHYHESTGIGGLNYISLGLGFFLGAQICAHVNDIIYRRLKQRYNGIGRPEFRVPMLIPAAICTPVGLFIYGWSAQARTHWIVPNIGALLFSAGTIMTFQCIQTYLVDSYARFAASAVGAGTVLRSLAGFGFPLFAPYMYQSLKYGWGNSVLAFVSIGLGIPAPFILWKYGEVLRKRSTFAAGGDK
ncbi:MAG: hypothetical protein M1834_003507 [Cirrosporium novae-zelandiae]|nr:MAG: hypothetical protein M1834_003507 [Cirrosporium novae-zelandiae]